MMDELKERYKMLPLYARLLAVSAIGLIPGGCMYFEDGEVLVNQLESTKADENQAQADFEDARSKKNNIGKLEAELHQTEEQLEKAKKELPESFRVEEILQKVATIARETGVEFVSFKPSKDGKCGEGEYKYMELPINGAINGTFNQAAMFYDRVSHLESSIFLRSIKMKRLLPERFEEEMRAVKEGDPEYARAKIVRRGLRVESVFEMGVYRSLGDAEQNKCEAQGAGGVGDYGDYGGGKEDSNQGGAPAPNGNTPPPNGDGAPPADDTGGGNASHGVPENVRSRT